MSSEKSEQLVLGLLHGDSRTWAAARQRLVLVPPKRRMRMRYLDEFAEKRGQSSIPVPYLHSTHESVLNPLGPADVSEWFAVSLLSSRGLNQRLESTGKQQIWRDLAHDRSENPLSVRGRLGTTIALELMQKSGTFETSGKDNPHYFDDMALIRAMAVAVSRSDAGLLETELREELRITASHDGIHAGVAMGKLVYELLEGSTPADAVKKVLSEIPVGSWTAAVAQQAVDLSAAAPSIEQLGYLLEKEIADHVYSYQVSAPETLAMVLAYLSLASSREELLLASFLNSSRSEVLTPVIWGLTGIIFGGFQASPGALQGVSITKLKGIEIQTMLEQRANQ